MEKSRRVVGGYIGVYVRRYLPTNSETMGEQQFLSRSEFLLALDKWNINLPKKWNYHEAV